VWSGHSCPLLLPLVLFLVLPRDFKIEFVIPKRSEESASRRRSPNPRPEPDSPAAPWKSGASAPRQDQKKRGGRDFSRAPNRNHVTGFSNAPHRESLMYHLWHNAFVANPPDHAQGKRLPVIFYRSELWAGTGSRLAQIVALRRRPQTDWSRHQDGRSSAGPSACRPAVRSRMES
jgi:hypothetical protein